MKNVMNAKKKIIAIIGSASSHSANFNEQSTYRYY